MIEMLSDSTKYTSSKSKETFPDQNSREEEEGTHLLAMKDIQRILVLE
jgi:hypothetical protein